MEHYPQSSKLDEAKERLGVLNSTLYLSPIESPDKTIYTVRPGDVITRVAAHTETTPELLMRVNNLRVNAKGAIVLQIGQRLMIPASQFTVLIQRKEQKVVLLRKGAFSGSTRSFPRRSRKKPRRRRKAPAPLRAR